ncbi:MAG: amidohydrolase family protein [Oscillospiraceae bacterium]|nr:amidohydrolase family protein [Oscillospiraceae bacterium]
MNYPIIDCHCHIYPDSIADRAVEGIKNFYDLDMAYDGRYHTLVASGNQISVKHYIIFSVATTPHQVHSINRFIADTVRQSGGLMTGLGTLHPDSDEIGEGIAEIKRLGLKGVKLHPDFQRFRVDDKKCFPIYEMCQAENLPVLLHTGDSRYAFSNPENVRPILEAFPKLTVIGAHFGGWSCWKEACRALSHYENFYVDCSSSFDWLTPEESAELVRAYTADRVLFGTDFPMWDHELEYKRFMAMELSDEDNRKILYQNACKLFSIEL